MKHTLLFGLLSLFVYACGSSSQADNDGLSVGGYTVYLLSEGQGMGNKDILLGATQEMMDETIPDGTFPIATNAFLLKTPEGKYTLIDTGYGKELFNNLDTLGVKPEEITTVLLTHTHGDHTSGLLRDDKIAFPNAEVLLSKQELEFWMTNDNPKAIAIREGYPIGTFDLIDIADADLKGNNSIQYIEAFGHTPGHTAILIGQGDKQLLIWADLTHAMAIQMPYPQVAVTYDNDTGTAIGARLKILEFVARHQIPVAGMHVAYPAMGTVKVNGKGGYVFTPLEK